MKTADIWKIHDDDERMRAFVERYRDLDEHTGNRTAAERDEMAEIADAILPALAGFWLRLECPPIDKAGRRKTPPVPVDGAELTEQLRTALAPLPETDRVSIPLSLFVTTAVEMGMPAAELKKFACEAIERYAAECAADDLALHGPRETRGSN